VTRSSCGGTGGGSAFGRAPGASPAGWGVDSGGVVGAGEVFEVSSAMVGTLVLTSGRASPLDERLLADAATVR